MSDISPARVAGNSTITYRVGGREYPLKTVRTCKVCMSPYRFDVEEDLLGGRTYMKIAQSLPEDAELNHENVRNHYRNGHLPLEQAAVRGIVEARAEAVGKRIEDNVETLIDGMALAEVVVEKTFQSIASGDIRPDVRDGLAAAKFLAEMGEYDEGGADMAAITEAFIVYHENAQQFMSAEQFEAFGKALKKNPVLNALARRYEGQGDTVSGEVVANREEALAGRLDNA